MLLCKLRDQQIDLLNPFWIQRRSRLVKQPQHCAQVQVRPFS